MHVGGITNNFLLLFLKTHVDGSLGHSACQQARAHLVKIKKIVVALYIQLPF